MPKLLQNSGRTKTESVAVDHLVPAYRKVFESVIATTVEEMWDFHSSASALRVLTPPSKHVELISATLDVVEGAIHEIRVRQFGIPIRWTALISEVEPPHRFVDTATKSPFVVWRHQHEFLAHAGGCRLRDTVDYTPPFGLFGGIANALFISRDLDSMFAYRHRATRQHFEG